MEYPSRRCIFSENVLTCAFGMESEKFSWVRQKGAQYCAVRHMRGAGLSFAPPPCQSVPKKNSTDPLGITAFMRNKRMLHHWVCDIRLCHHRIQPLCSKTFKIISPSGMFETGQRIGFECVHQLGRKELFYYDVTLLINLLQRI